MLVSSLPFISSSWSTVTGHTGHHPLEHEQTRLVGRRSKSGHHWGGEAWGTQSLHCSGGGIWAQSQDQAEQSLRDSTAGHMAGTGHSWCITVTHSVADQ
jgi:hypothetical protein